MSFVFRTKMKVVQPDRRLANSPPKNINSGSFGISTLRNPCKTQHALFMFAHNGKTINIVLNEAFSSF